MNEEQLNIYVIEVNGEPDDCPIVSATSPEEAAEKYINDYNPDEGDSIWVHSSIPVHLVMNAELILDDMRNRGSHDGQLEDVTPYQVAELQKLLDGWAESLPVRYYQADKPLHNVKPKETPE
jgi:hypothetical protein